MVDALFETYARRSIVRAIKAALPSLLVLERGSKRQAPETEEEWLSFDELAITPSRSSRRGLLEGSLLFQVGCFSRHAELRADGLGDAPTTLAAQVRATLEKQDVAVYDYGKGPTLSFLGVVQCGVAAWRYMDEATLDDSPSDVHAVMLTFDARIVN